jgi:hypothetical protein
MKFEILDSVLSIEGVVENVDDCNQISKNIQNIAKKNNNQVNIIFKDSFIIPSTLIGQILKLIQVDKITVNVQANSDLYTLLDRLNLLEAFNVSMLSEQK